MALAGGFRRSLGTTESLSFVRDNTMRILAIALLFVSTAAFAGYDLHVTRKESWADESGPKITFVEWKAYVRSDHQISRDTMNREEDFLVSLPKETFPVWYDVEFGEIYTKNPSKNAIRKLSEIAKKLKAKVQGDDGELYPAKP